MRGWMNMLTKKKILCALLAGALSLPSCSTAYMAGPQENVGMVQEMARSYSLDFEADKNYTE